MSEAPPPRSGHLLVQVPCSVRGRTASSVELVPPGERPAWRFLFHGIERGNGSGDDIAPEEAAQLAEAFSPPLTYEKVRRAGVYDDAGFCSECRAPYCSRHWSVDVGGYGRCPRGHGRSLDPHWSPEDY